MSRRRRPTAYPSRRTKTRRVVNVKRLVLSILLLLLVGEAVLALLTSPWFHVKNTRVEGNKTVSAKEIVRALRTDPGTNIFLLDKRKLQARVLRNPVIDDIKLHRRLPHTLVARITERRADVLVRTGGVLYEVDARGIPFRVVDGNKRAIPVVNYLPPLIVKLGKPIRSESFNVAKKCLLSAKATKNLGATGITVDLDRDLCLNTPDGFRVILGRPEQLEEKLKCAAEAAGGMPGFRQRGEYINVMSLPNVFVKYKD